MDPIQLLASMVMGLAIVFLVRILMRFVWVRTPETEPTNSFERARRVRLADKSTLYRWFAPGVDKLIRFNSRLSQNRRDTFQRALQMSGDGLVLVPEEYLALRQMESSLIGVAGFVVGLLAFNFAAGLLMAAIMSVTVHQLVVGTIGSKAKKRLARIKQRLPFTIDLMALMMEAGAGFLDSLTTAVRELQGHPLGDELALILRDISLGRPRQEALLGFRDRMADDDITEIVFAVNKGEELGTPLAQILRTQAEQMRLKRTQWAEKASGEAQVSIVFPGMVIMVACLIIVTAPFILNAALAQQ